MTPKAFYRTYIADDKVSEMSEQLLTLISKESPNHAFEFGMGSGKHLRRLREKEIACFGMDISILNCIRAQSELMGGVAMGDERYLRHLVNFDCVFTVSVLDHIEEINGIIQELKRISNKCVFLAETNDEPADFYYPHDYESYGFEKVNDSEWIGEDGATYFIWKWTKQ